MVRLLRRCSLNMAFSPSQYSHPKKMKGMTPDMTAVAMTLPSDQDLVTPPHCVKRMTQHPHAIAMATPSQSHLANAGSIARLYPLYVFARPSGGVVGWKNTRQARATPPNLLVSSNPTLRDQLYSRQIDVETPSP